MVHRFQYKWGVYSTPSEQWQLWDALDARGERESELKSAIKARFDIEEPPVVYQTTGSDYIGKKVKRIFGKKVIDWDDIVAIFYMTLANLFLL